MKIRAKANGEVIDVSEETAAPLLEAGIYERVAESVASTKVEPLMTTDAAPLVRKGKSK
jgi:hypothetical protein